MVACFIPFPLIVLGFTAMCAILSALYGATRYISCWLQVGVKQFCVAKRGNNTINVTFMVLDQIIFDRDKGLE